MRSADRHLATDDSVPNVPPASVAAFSRIVGYASTSPNPACGVRQVLTRQDRRSAEASDCSRRSAKDLRSNIAEVRELRVVDRHGLLAQTAQSARGAPQRTGDNAAPLCSLSVPGSPRARSSRSGLPSAVDSPSACSCSWVSLRSIPGIVAPGEQRRACVEQDHSPKPWPTLQDPGLEQTLAAYMSRRQTAENIGTTHTHRRQRDADDRLERRIARQVLLSGVG